MSVKLAKGVRDVILIILAGLIFATLLAICLKLDDAIELLRLFGD